MAEIHVQSKKQQHTSPAWIWIIVGLLIAAAVIYFISTRNKSNQNNAPNQTNTTSGIELPQQFTITTYIMSTCC
jgi:hypothetical protein